MVAFFVKGGSMSRADVYATTLGQPFRTEPRSRDFFDCEPEQLPFTERIGLRGRMMMFESQFQNGSAPDPGLLNDLDFLCDLKLGECSYGAGTFPMHPFLCALENTGRRPTGADLLGALKARDFKSVYIQSLDVSEIPYPGYNPGDGTGHVNDEIHNDFFKQKLFPHGDEDSVDEIDEFSGVHGELKRAVVDGQLWYVLLHITPEQFNDALFSNYVVLFAVGQSKNGDWLIGAVTHQVCHNLCD